MQIELVEGTSTGLVGDTKTGLVAGTGFAPEVGMGTVRRGMNRLVAVGRGSGAREGIAVVVLRRERESGSRAAGYCTGSRSGCPS